MSQQPIDIVVKVQQLTAEAFGQVQRELKKLEDQAASTGKTTSGSLAGGVTQFGNAAKDATQKTSLWGSAMGSVRTIAIGMVAGFSLDAIIGGIGRAVASTIDWAGGLSDLSAKVGASTTALQRWEFAGNRSGNTLEELVNAAQELGRRISEGENSTVAAFDALGLSIDDLRKMSPEQQFETVAAALNKVTDSGKMTSLAVDTMGKTAKSILPTIKNDLAAVGDEAERLGAVVGKDTIEAMDGLGDAWGDLKLIGRGVVSEILEMTGAIEGLDKLAKGIAASRQPGAMTLMEQAAMGLNNPLLMQLAGMAAGDRGLKKKGDISLETPKAGEWKPSSSTVVNAEEWYIEQYIKPAEEARKKESAAALKLAEAEKRLAAFMAERAEELATKDRFMAMYGRMNAAAGGPVIRPGELASADLVTRWGSLPNSILGGGGTNISMAGRERSELAARGGGIDWNKTSVSAVSAAMPYLAQLITGGSKSSQIGGTVGGSVGGIVGSMSSVTSFLGPWAQLIGPAAGIVGGLIGKMFGPSQGKLASQDRASYISGLGGAEGFNQQFRDAQISSAEAQRLTSQLMSANSRDAVAKAQEAINAALQRNNALLAQQEETESSIASLEERRKGLVESLVPSADQLAAITAKYGLNIEGLGSAFNQIGATATWKTMLDDFDKLNAASANVGGYLTGMADDVSKLVNESKRLGTEIPENMRPYIAELARSGQLLDENGEAMTDISTLNWGTAVETEAQKTTTAIKEIDRVMSELKTVLQDLVRQLRGDMPAAAQIGAQGIEEAFDDVDIRIPYSFEREGDLPTSSGYATGGLARTPQIAPIAEREPEMIGPVSFMERALTGALRKMGGGWNSVVEVPVYLDGRLVARGVAPHLQTAVR